MTRRRAGRLLLFVLVLVAAVYSALAPPEREPERSRDWVVPAVRRHADGLVIDNATTRSLSFRWIGAMPVGESDAIPVQYRLQGVGDWKAALPLERVARDGDLDLFAGRILNLQPATSYEVRIDLPTGGGGETSEHLLLETRAEPVEPPASARPMHVYSLDVDAPGSSNDGLGLQEALRRARPGDVVLVHAGTYDGPLQVQVTGTAELPITVRSAGDGEVLLRNPGGDVGPVITAEWGRNHIRFEGMTIRVNGLGTAIQADESDGWVVRRCLVYGGIRTGARDWHVVDNVFLGRYTDWRQRVRYPGGIGILVRGRGHVIEHNSVSRFWDGIVTTPARPDEPGAFADELRPTAIDIHDNLVYAIVDDGIEVDLFAVNVSVMRNRIVNSYVGMSLQEVGPGPVYVVRNVISNVLQDPWKIFAGATGLRLFHNTTLNWLHGTRLVPPDLRNSTLLNNVILGFRFGLFVGGHDERSRFDYNALRTPRDGPPLSWSRDGGTTWLEVADLEAVAGSSDAVLGKHNLIIDEATDMTGAISFDYREDVNPETLDLRLASAGRAVDAGERIATVNDDFSGEAPDLGAYELGDEVPHYGPRWPVGPDYRYPEDLEHRATGLAYAAQPAGIATMTLRERFIRFTDRHDLPVSNVLTAAAVLVLAAALGIGFALVRRFPKT